MKLDNSVAIISRLDYLNKMKHLISDRTKFRGLQNNPTKSTGDSLSAYLRKLRNDKIIDDAIFYKILASGSPSGVLYGLPNVRKTGCPFRPFFLSYLVAILQPILTNQCTVKDSISFASCPKKYKHDIGIMFFWCLLHIYKCATWGNETLDIRLDKFYFLVDPPTLPRVVLGKLKEFVTKKSHFLFDGKYYDQIDGVAMGSSLGPVFRPCPLKST